MYSSLACVCHMDFGHLSKHVYTHTQTYIFIVKIVSKIFILKIIVPKVLRIFTTKIIYLIIVHWSIVELIEIALIFLLIDVLNYYIC